MTQTLPHSETIELGKDDVFARVFLNIRSKKKKIIPFLYNASQRHIAPFLTGRDIILKARQLGFSTFIQGRIFRANLGETSAALTISDVDKNTQKLRDISNRFYNQWPENLILLRPTRDKDSAAQVTYPHVDSESVIVTAGAKTGGRGGTTNYLHGSEVAFWPDVQNIFNSALQSVTPDGEVYLESTANGAQGLFHELCMRALDGDGRWKLHFYPWWWAEEYQTPLDVGEELSYTENEIEVIATAAASGFHLSPEQIKWRREKQEDLPHTFRQEYPEDPYSCFLGSGTGFFGDVSHAFYTPDKHEPEDGHVYVGGIDWGQAEDWTVLSIGDVTTNRQVAVLRLRRLPWKVMRRKIVEVCHFWGVKKGLVEINSIGGVNFEILTSDPQGIEWLPFTTSAQSKPGLVQSLYRALHELGLKLIDFKQNQIAVQRAEFAAFQATQSPHSMKWSYQAAKGQHDDCVIAAGLMALMMQRPTVGRIRSLE